MSNEPNQASVPELSIQGRFLKLAKLREEWDIDVPDPGLIVENLRACGRHVDLFTFIQRLPRSRPRFSYPMEWDNVAAIPITDYQSWYSRQIHRNARNKLKKAEKEGLTVKVVPFDDEFVSNIKRIQDSTRIRQGRPFGHYGKSLETIRKGHGTFLERATCIGAFHQGEMVGFFKVVTTQGYARVMGLLTDPKHNDRAPMNSLMAKAVELCAEKGIPYLVYAKYDYGKTGSDTLLEFKESNGFEHILLPRYYIPLTSLGEAALSTRAHRGVVQFTPRPVVRWYRDLRARYHGWRLNNAA